MARARGASPLPSALPIGIADSLVVVLGHAALVRSVAAVAVLAGCGHVIVDAAQVGDEAAQHDLGRDAVGLAQLDELVGQFDGELVLVHGVLQCDVIRRSLRAPCDPVQCSSRYRSQA